MGPLHLRRCPLAGVLARVAILWSVIAQLTRCENKENGFDLLPLHWTYPQQCEVLEVTWKPESDAFPYSVYIVSVRSRVSSFLITEDYEHEEHQLTFQYVIPEATNDFYGFVVSVADSKGRGNTTDVLQVNFGEEPKNPCQEYSQGQTFVHAAENANGVNKDRPSCAPVKYHLVQGEFDWSRPVPPYSITLLPIRQQPITVDIPSTAVQGNYFEYSMPIPFKKGTHFLEFVSDSSEGGSGGSSPIYTTSKANDTYCLEEEYSLPNVNESHRLPPGKTEATFQNLSGAMDWPHEKAADAKRSRMVGGMIGGVISVCLFVLITTLYMVYSERAKSLRENERREGPQFVDLDEDEYHESILRIRRRKREDNRQYYNILPFTHGLGSHSPPQVRECEHSCDAVHGHATGMSSGAGLMMPYPDPNAFLTLTDKVDDQDPADMQHNSCGRFPTPVRSGIDSSHTRVDSLEDVLPSKWRSTLTKAIWNYSSATPDQSVHSEQRTQQVEENTSEMMSKTSSTSRHANTPPSMTRGCPEEAHEMYNMPGTTCHSTRSEYSNGNDDVLHDPIHATGPGVSETSRASQGGSRMVVISSLPRCVDAQPALSTHLSSTRSAQLEDLQDDIPASRMQVQYPDSPGR